MAKTILSFLLITAVLAISAFTNSTLIPNSFAEESRLPDWVKDIFVWYGQGQISENDVLNAIAFLVTNQIIQIEMVNESMNPHSQEIMEHKISWNVDAPVIIPLSEGYHDRNMVYFIHPEISDSSMAERLSERINFPTSYVPELKNISEERLAKVYVFTNGVSGSEPYGGGFFMFQTEVFNSVPGNAEYSQFRQPYLVTWNEDAKPRILNTESKILTAESAGELVVEKSDWVLNIPVIAWEVQGNYGKAMSKTSTIPRVFEGTTDIQGELSFIDEKKHIAILKLQSE